MRKNKTPIQELCSTVSRLEEILGCGDSGCLFIKPTDQHTNGVEAINADAAVLRVVSAINSGRLNSTSLEWGEHDYEFGTFSITGDVDEAGPKDKLTKIKSP